MRPDSTAHCRRELPSVFFGGLNGKEIHKGGDMCINIADSSAVQQKLIQDCKATVCQ